MRTVNSGQVYDFIGKLRTNVQTLEDIPENQRLDYVRRQYELLRILRSVIMGNTYFLGIDHAFKENIDGNNERPSSA